ncbi:glycosyltransferase family 2 protein [Candidatus Dojkabacteria bacterium]|nr:glycosyltransferase family 2 protein [Candidatus Dojkabacteria bacterium]
MYYFERSKEVLKNEGILGLLKRAAGKLKRLSIYPDQNKLYATWIENVEKVYLSGEDFRKQISEFKKSPKISILMPVYNVDSQILKEAVASVMSQWYENWELCLYDDASTNQNTIKYLEELQANDRTGKLKIKFGEENQNISGATNEAFAISSGEYLMLMDNDDILHSHALYEIVKLLNKKGDQDLVYFDEDKLDKFGTRIEPWFKPDFSPELMWSMMYPTHAVYSREIFEKSGKMRKGYEGSQDYDLCLRVMELTERIEHIPWVLYSWRKVEGSTASDIKGKSYAIDSAKKALRDALGRRGLKGEIIHDFYPFLPVLEVAGSPSIEIIIPIKDKIELLKTCLESIWENTSYNNYSVTVVDNNSELEETKEYLGQIKDKVRVLDYPHEYNFSAINNFAAKQSRADYILFLNNDTKVVNSDWLSGLLMWAQQKEIGAVGCKLLCPDRKVQHAGILLGVGGVANHAYYRQPEENNFYFNQLHCVRNYLAVTGACMMLSKAKFDEVGGFNEELPLAFNDVDLCLKLYEKGYRNVYTPYVELYHYESKSRDPQVSEYEDKYMQGKWSGFINNDPYYNPNLNKDLNKKPVWSL